MLNSSRIKTRINIHMDNFDEHAKDVLREVRECNSVCDVVMRTSSKSKKFPAHRLVLCFCSDFLRKILEETSSAIVTPTIIIPDVADDVLESILDFMYTGEIRVKEDRFNDFVDACNLLQLKSMINTEYVKASSEPGITVEREESEIQDTLMDSEGVEYQIVTQKDSGNEETFEIEVIQDPSSTNYLSGQLQKHKGLVKRPVSKRERAEDEITEPTEQIQKALDDIIHNKISFQQAAEKYNQSKTLLWRMAQTTPEYHQNRTQPSNPEKNQIILEALKAGETLLSISKKYNVPVSTLHRRKSMLFEQGELPDHVRIKQRNRGEDFTQRLELAINDVVSLGVSQTEVAKKYRIPKTTIWRRLKRLSEMDPKYKHVMKSEGSLLEAIEIVETHGKDNISAEECYEENYQEGDTQIIVSEVLDESEVAELEGDQDVGELEEESEEPQIKYIKLRHEVTEEESVEQLH